MITVVKELDETILSVCEREIQRPIVLEASGSSSLKCGSPSPAPELLSQNFSG